MGKFILCDDEELGAGGVRRSWSSEHTSSMTNQPILG